jgi:hypothetical protein
MKILRRGRGLTLGRGRSKALSYFGGAKRLCLASLGFDRLELAISPKVHKKKKYEMSRLSPTASITFFSFSFYISQNL